LRKAIFDSAIAYSIDVISYSRFENLGAKFLAPEEVSSLRQRRSASPECHHFVTIFLEETNFFTTEMEHKDQFSPETTYVIPNGFRHRLWGDTIFENLFVPRLHLAVLTTR